MNIWFRVLVFLCADVFGSLALAQAMQGNAKYAAAALVVAAFFLFVLHRIARSVAPIDES